MWKSSPGTSTNEWLEVELKAISIFNQIIIKESSYYERLEQYKVQYFDGTSWADILCNYQTSSNYTKEGRTGFTIWRFKPVVAKKVRLLVLSTKYDPNTYGKEPQLFEFEIYPENYSLLAKEAKASSEKSYSYKAAMAIDGDSSNTRWSAAGKSAVEWLEINFAWDLLPDYVVIKQNVNRITGCKIQIYDGIRIIG